MDSVQYLFHGSETMKEEIIGLPILLFGQILDLIKHVTGNNNSADQFVLVVPGDCLEQLRNDVVYKFSQVRQIYVYYEDFNQMKQDQDRYKESETKLRFCYKRNLKILLKTFEVTTATRSPELNYEVAVHESASSCEQKLSPKRSNDGTGYWPVPRRINQTQSNQNDATGKNENIVRDVYITQVTQSTLRESTKQTISPFISTSMHLSNSSSAMNDKKQSLSIHLVERIRAISTVVNSIHDKQQRIVATLQGIGNSFETLNRDLSSIQATVQDNLNRAVAMKSTQDRLIQEIRSTASGTLSTSNDSPYQWKITNVREKIRDAQSERNKSLYSPPFYSSTNGYKLCLRLYLNGDDDTRDKHLSLFIVVMKGESDAVLDWPFSFPVIFRLINQSAPNDNQGDIIRCLRPDVTSHCFRRPSIDMNEAFGIKCFVSIEDFEQNQRSFIKDDRMLIEVKIDLMNESAWITPSAGGLPNDEEHVDGNEQESAQSDWVSRALVI